MDTKAILKTHLGHLEKCPHCDASPLKIFPHGSITIGMYCHSCKKRVLTLTQTQTIAYLDEMNQRIMFIARSYSAREYLRKYNLRRELFMTDQGNRVITIESNQSELFGDEEQAKQAAQAVENFTRIRQIGGSLLLPPETKSDNCAHLWTLLDDTSAKCVCCGAIRSLSETELELIPKVEKAGARVLRYEQRLAELAKIPTKSRKRRRSRSGTSQKRSTSSTSAVKEATEVPEGFVPVAEAAKELGIDAKKLRRLLRSGKYESAKVGGRVYAKIQ